MTDTKSHMESGGSLEGRVFRPASPAETAEAIEFAFDYRGDVTLELRSGETIAGYIYNRQAAGPQPTLDMYPSDSLAPKTIPYQMVVSIAFTGEDTANGKSWEAWASKKESERRAEAAKVEADARARGLL
ncbi:MAG: hypothetical protein U0412_02930 [Nitrospira sp.]